MESLSFRGFLKFQFKRPYHVIKFGGLIIATILMILAIWEKQILYFIPSLLLFLHWFDPTLRIEVTDTHIHYRSKLLFILNHSCLIQDIDGWGYYGHDLAGNWPSFALIANGKMVMRIPSYFNYSEIEAWAKSRFEEVDISIINVSKPKS